MLRSSRKTSLNAALLALATVVALPASSQILGLTSPSADTSIQVSGQISRSGVGVATYNSKLWVVYSSHSSNGNLFITYQTGSNSYATPVQVPGAVVNNNPQIAVYNNKLLISWVDNTGLLMVATTTDGLNFTNLGNCQGVIANSSSFGAFDSPSMAVLKNFLYIGFRTSNGSLGICTVFQQTTNLYTLDASFTSGFNLGDAPGLGTFNGVMYIAYKDNSGSNFIHLLETIDGVNFSVNDNALSNHTSTQPSLVEYLGVLYIGYRQNSSDDEFYYTYSTDGTTFQPFVSETWGMGGPPALVVGPDGKFYNIFSGNSSSHFLSTSSTQ
ncbi:MAG TPA: hypothetical protein VE291_03270 [Terracidiphilus sp.]|jgi:hypothetical protein|nr:hypothetical protein [Terracidiphilus sp.]